MSVEAGDMGDKIGMKRVTRFGVFLEFGAYLELGVWNLEFYP